MPAISVSNVKPKAFLEENWTLLLYFGWLVGVISFILFLARLASGS